MNKPKLSILFWFYKEPEICINRLKLIRKFNPGVKIHGLFGGEIKDAEKYRVVLNDYLDTFWSPKVDFDSSWKWIHGDLLILNWYQEFGLNLDFDSLVIVQWDMLIFDSVHNQFKELKKDEMYLSGLRSLDSYTEQSWEWTSPNKEYRKDYLDFIKYVDIKYNYKKNIKPCCLFVLEVIPKKFFEMYSKVEQKELGMLEYKIPIYAEIFGIKMITRSAEAHWWDNVEKYPLNAEPTEIKMKYIKDQLKIKNGWRIFHPYFKLWED